MLRNLATEQTTPHNVTDLVLFKCDAKNTDTTEVAYSDKQLHVIDAITAHEGNPRCKSRMTFTVKWKGYDEDSNTWEPWENVAKVGILHEYLAATPGLTQFVNKNLVTDPDDLS
jgi:hypothetical protein